MERAEQPADAEIVRRVLSGDAGLYRVLVERHSPAVFNAALRLVGRREVAADIAQEAFLRAYQALARFDPARPLRPWLCRIAVNLSLNWLKRQRPTISLDNPGTAPALLASSPDADPHNATLRLERQQILHRAILSLPPEQRAVIELRHFQELSYQEIADSLNLSLSNVKSRLFRARKNLRQILEETHLL